jgi:hypothetical protein
MINGKTNSAILPIQFSAPISVAFDLQAFEDNIKAHGLQFIHYRATRDPVGLIDRDDTRRPNPSDAKSSNGFHYTKAGIITALCLGNTKETKASDAGLVDSSMAQFTPLSTYEDSGKRVFLSTYDKVYLQEESVLVSRTELIEAQVTRIDRPKFPVIEVLDCIDANCKQYYQRADFEITTSGLIKWGDRNPGSDPESGKGIIFSIRYVYRPYWYVQRLVHEIRMIQQENFATGERKVVQAPQSAIIVREHFFESEANSESRAAAEKPADGQVVAQ